MQLKKVQPARMKYWILALALGGVSAVALLRWVIPAFIFYPTKEVIDFRMGRELFDSYGGPKAFLRIRGPHNGGWLSDMAAYEKGVRDFLENLRPR